MIPLSDYDYELPRELIAAHPPQDRASARLLAVRRSDGSFRHVCFRDLLEMLQPGDVLVLNDTKVVPARLFGTKPTGGRVEALLLKELGQNRWEALLRPGGRLKKGLVIDFGANGEAFEAMVLDDCAADSGKRTLEFFGEAVKEKIAQIGHIPLPPYIDRPDTPLDHENYQTVFARHEGAVASPTAGLHFTRELLEALEKKGVEIAYVTLHVSYATFQPVTAEDVTQHKMFGEAFTVSEAAAETLNCARRDGRRVVACGTTSVRTVESAADQDGLVRAQTGETTLFIYPGYEFKVVRGMITNFHLPKTSLLLMLAAFMGRDNMMAVYAEAIRQKYKFYSYGDAMVVL